MSMKKHQQQLRQQQEQQPQHHRPLSMSLWHQLFPSPSLETVSSFDSSDEDGTEGSFLEQYSVADTADTQSQLQPTKRKQSVPKPQRKLAFPLSSQPLLNIQLECFRMSDDEDVNEPGLLRFRKYNMVDVLTDETVLRPKDVIIAVEATTICERDLAMRRLKTGKKSIILGCNVVGIVRKCGTAAHNQGIRVGTRVAAIVKHGGNAKYVTVSASKLVNIPNNLDPCDVACLLSVYLPAFQALHHGRARPYRYSRLILDGRKVFVNGSSLQAQAVARLAHLAGAKRVYVAAPEVLHSHLRKQNLTVLEVEPETWMPYIQGGMDIAVDLEFPDNFLSTQEVIKKQGRIVCSYPQFRETTSWMDTMASAVDYYNLFMSKRATLFDFYESASQYKEELREDLTHLLKLLDTRELRPKIELYIKLEDVPSAHQKMEDMIMTGAIVCEPWKE